MINDVRIIDGEWVAVTGWYEPNQKPVRIGDYQIAFFDCGWQYEAWAFWNGDLWMDKRGGNSLIDQQQTWRGLTEKTA